MARLKANVGYKDAIGNCELALSLDSKNIKALFRMAQVTVRPQRSLHTSALMFMLSI
jgi:hypothetical protein